MKPSSLLGHAAELLRIMSKNPKPGEKTAASYFRQKRYLGSTDRRIISDTVYSAYRLKILLEHLTKGHNFKSAYKFLDELLQIMIYHSIADLDFFLQDDDAEILAMDSALRGTISKAQIDASELNNLAESALLELSRIVETLKKDMCTDDEFIEASSLLYSLPEWINRMIWFDYGFERKEHLDFLQSTISPAPLGIRVNMQKISRDEALENLRNSGFDAHPGQLSPAAITLRGRANISSHELYQAGFIEIQDEGSQMIGYAASDTDHGTALDACAGAGGKSLQLADIAGNSLKITASDIEIKRLKEVAPRSKKAGLENIRTVHIKQGKNSPLGRNYDIVLVDAPCSGTGTIRRVPLHKYKLTKRLMDKLAARQYDILSEYSKFVKPGGSLVYATCSILRDENDRVIDSFLRNNQDFEPEPLAPVLNRHGINTEIIDDEYKLRLFPHEYGTDGFFAARIRKLK